MQKIIKTIVLTALSLFICLPAGAKTDAEVHKILEEVAEDYRASLPMSVNTNTTWYGARRDLIAKRRLVYLYRLKIPRADLSRPLHIIAATQKAESLAYFCSQPALEPFREIGVSFEYNYSDSDTQYLFSVYLDPSECPDGHSGNKSSRMTIKKTKRKTL